MDELEPLWARGGPSEPTGLIDPGFDFSACFCRMHKKVVLPEGVFQGCAAMPVGTHHALVAAEAGRAHSCQVSEATRRNDREFQLMCVDGGEHVQSFAVEAGFTPAWRYATGNLPFSAFSRGFCYLQGFHTPFFPRLARVLGGTPYVLDVMKALRVAGRAVMKPLKVTMVAPGYYHVTKDKSRKGLVETAGVEYYCALAAIAKDYPHARVGLSPEDVSGAEGAVVGPAVPGWCTSVSLGEEALFEMVRESYGFRAALAAVVGVAVFAGGVSRSVETVEEQGGDVRVERSGACSSVGLGFAGLGDDSAVGSGSTSVERGKHYERNKRKRRNKLAAVRGGKAGGARCAPISVFSECDPVKVKEARETQLRALTVKNELACLESTERLRLWREDPERAAAALRTEVEAAEEAAKWKKQQFSRKMWRSDAYLSSDNKRIFKSELEAEDTMLRLAKKRGVQGWAETVLSGSTESRQSVHSAWSAKGKTESVSADSSVSEEACEAKVAALETKVKALELEVDTYRKKYGSDSGYDESYEVGLFESW